MLKVPKEAFHAKKRRRVNDLHCDYLKRHQKPANRRRTDPVVVLSSILENILNEMRDLPNTGQFLFPVSSKVKIFYLNIFLRLACSPPETQIITKFILKYIRSF